MLRVTVLPGSAVSTLPLASIERLTIVNVPSSGNVQLYVHETFEPGQEVHEAEFQFVPPSVDISMPATFATSAAVPVMVYGLVVKALKVVPSTGSVIVDVGAVLSILIVTAALAL